MSLRLLAQDGDDLQIVSAALQDAVAKLGDIRFDSGARTLTVALNRFRWEAGAQKRTGERVRSALQLGGVLGVQARNLRQGAPDAVVELLAIAFEPGDAPGGAVLFTFSGGGDLRAEVEALDAILTDVSDPWPAKRAPAHNG